MGNAQTKIEVVVGDLAREKADVLVNTIGTEAKLVAGSVSYAILEGGGNSLQEDISREHPYGLKVGEIAQTSGGNLECEKVFHVVLRQWMNVDDDAEALLYRVVTECLQWADSQKFTSIAFPALGAGFHRFPGNRSADIMFRAIETFRKKWFGINGSLKTVKIVVHSRDDLNRKDFLARRVGIDVVHENYLSKSIILQQETESRQELKLNVVIGCLAQHKSDVLVNTTQPDLNLSVGAVSRSLLMKGGKILQIECLKQCPQGLSFGDMVQTQGGTLKCKKVFHIVVPMWNNGKGNSEEGFKKVVMGCLEEASIQNLESVSFPVLGTGYLQYPLKTSIALMFEAIIKFKSENVDRSVKTVTIVVAHKDYDNRKIIEQYIDGRGDDATLHTTPLPGSMLITGEEDALKKAEVKYFPLAPGCFLEGSNEERHFNMVVAHFFKFLEKDEVNRHIYNVTKVEYVINSRLLMNFRSAQKQMSEEQGREEKEVLVYHGTPEKNVRSICEEGFRKPDDPDYEEENDKGWYGNGIYFSEYPRFSMNYMRMSRMLLLCKVLQGKVFKCSQKTYGGPKQQGYDSHMDPVGKEIVIFHEDRILPCYIVYFDICERFKRKDDSYCPQENDKSLIEYLCEMELQKGTFIPKE